MGSRMRRHGIVLAALLFALLQIQTAYAINPGSRESRMHRPQLDPYNWDLISDLNAVKHPYSSTVRMRSYNTSRLFEEPYPGIGAWGSCTGTVIAWNMILTAAHCMYDPWAGYQYEVVDMIPGGAFGSIDYDYESGLEEEPPAAFGTYLALRDEHVNIYPKFVYGGFANDISVVVLPNPIAKDPLFHVVDATMQLNMMQSFDYDEYDGVPETLSDADTTFYHFPAQYPVWVLEWGKMHYSHGDDVQIGTLGEAHYNLNNIKGSSGASIQVEETTSVENGGSAGGSRIRIVHGSGYNGETALDDPESFGNALSTNHLYWIAGVMNTNKAAEADIDGVLAPAKETEVCLCLSSTTQSATLKVVAAPLDDNCVCAQGSSVVPSSEFLCGETECG